MKKKIVCLLLIALLSICSVFAFTGCGEKDDRQVVVVGYTDYPPMNYTDSDSKLVGFDTELAEAVFAELDYRVVFKEISWDNKYIDLDTGNIDCIWNGFTANTADSDGIQRSTKVDFSYNYMLNKQCVVILDENSETYTTADSFANTIGYVEASSAGATYAGDLFGDNVTINTATKQMDAITQVVSRSATFAVVDYQLANSIAGQGNYEDLVIIDALTSSEEYYAIGFKKGSTLTAKVNETLVKLANDGTVATIAEKYKLASAVITDYSSQIED